MSNVVQILKDARALIADKKNWTQCDLARDVSGGSIDFESPDAVCFCSLGAIGRITAVAGCHPSVEFSARDKLRSFLSGGHTISSFNDTHTHAEVLALFDRAIARAESEAVQ